MNIVIVIDTHKIYSIHAYITIRNSLFVLIIMSMLTSYIQHSIRAIAFDTILDYFIRYSIFHIRYYSIFDFRTYTSTVPYHPISILYIIPHITGTVLAPYNRIRFDTLCIYTKRTYVGIFEHIIPYYGINPVELFHFLINWSNNLK